MVPHVADHVNPLRVPAAASCRSTADATPGLTTRPPILTSPAEQAERRPAALEVACGTCPQLTGAGRSCSASQGHHRRRVTPARSQPSARSGNPAARQSRHRNDHRPLSPLQTDRRSRSQPQSKWPERQITRYEWPHRVRANAQEPLLTAPRAFSSTSFITQ